MRVKFFLWVYEIVVRGTMVCVYSFLVVKSLLSMVEMGGSSRNLLFFEGRSFLRVGIGFSLMVEVMFWFYMYFIIFIVGR